jgi:hypothetical protein
MPVVIPLNGFLYLAEVDEGFILPRRNTVNTTIEDVYHRGIIESF